MQTHIAQKHQVQAQANAEIRRLSEIKSEYESHQRHNIATPTNRPMEVANIYDLSPPLNVHGLEPIASQSVQLREHPHTQPAPKQWCWQATTP